jgi:hypothetical protein
LDVRNALAAQLRYATELLMTELTVLHGCMVVFRKVSASSPLDSCG